MQVPATDSQAVLGRLVDAWKAWKALCEDEADLNVQRAKSALGTALGDLRAIMSRLKPEDAEFRDEIVSFDKAWREFNFRGGAAENKSQRRAWDALQNAYNVLKARSETLTDSNKPLRRM